MRPLINNQRATTATLLLLSALSVAAGCSAAPTDDPGDIAEEDIGAADVSAGARVDPLLMPRAIVDYQNLQGWGRHHLEWHTSRRWDLLGESDIAWAQRQGWRRAALQEGQPGNGLEFLAMHRVMLRRLATKFPRHAALFNGWKQPPQNPKDRTDPLPGGADEAFDPAMQGAVARLMDDAELVKFRTDDELGLFLETRLRPSRTDPRKKSDDAGAGLHNYLHNRFTDPASKIDIGDPSVNLANKRFWRLHGWIESVWTRYRTLKALPDTETRYAKAIALAEAEMTEHGGVRSPRPEPIPETLRRLFTLE